MFNRIFRSKFFDKKFLKTHKNMLVIEQCRFYHILFFFIFCINLSLSHLQRHFDAIAAVEFWKYCGKSRNCSWWAISPLATMFSTSFNNYAIFYGNFSGFCHYVLVCCRFVVCEKGLNIHYFSSFHLHFMLLFNPFLNTENLQQTTK